MIKIIKFYMNTSVYDKQSFNFNLKLNNGAIESNYNFI